MKIVVLDGYTTNPGDLSWDALESLGDVTIFDRTSQEDVIKRIGDAEAVFTSKCKAGQKLSHFLNRHFSDLFINCHYPKNPPQIKSVNSIIVIKIAI